MLIVAPVDCPRDSYCFSPTKSKSRGLPVGNRELSPWSQNSGATPPCPPTPTTPPSLGGIPFDHPVIEPTFPREVPFPNSPQNVMGFPQDGKCIIVYFKTKLHLHMGAEGDEKAPYWLLRRPVRAEDRPLTSPLPRAWGVTD